MSYLCALRIILVTCYPQIAWANHHTQGCPRSIQLPVLDCEGTFAVIADVHSAMANRPSHPTCSPRAPIPQSCKAASCEPPSSDHAQRAPTPNFSPPARYQLFSALRTTDEQAIKVEEEDSHSECSSEGKQSCCSMNVAVPSPCEECVQECEEGSCDLRLTEQCTDQCVVVPCNDAHHGYVPCEEANVVAGCDIMCTDDPECDAFDSIVSNYRAFL